VPFFRTIFDQELTEWVLSFVRDLVKLILMMFGIVAMHLMFQLLIFVGVPKEKVELFESLELYMTWALMFVTGVIFIGKMSSAKKNRPTRKPR
jgi:hypothetical protein